MVDQYPAAARLFPCQAVDLRSRPDWIRPKPPLKTICSTRSHWRSIARASRDRSRVVRRSRISSVEPAAGRVDQVTALEQPRLALGSSPTDVSFLAAASVRLPGNSPEPPPGASVGADDSTRVRLPGNSAEASPVAPSGSPRRLNLDPRSSPARPYESSLSTRKQKVRGEKRHPVASIDFDGRCCVPGDPDRACSLGGARWG
jgi:hypothetical protein